MKTSFSTVFASVVWLCQIIAGAGKVRAQESWPEHVFVLVDASGSMRNPAFGVGLKSVAEARDFVKALLLDKFVPASFPQWQDNTQPDQYGLLFSGLIKTPNDGQGVMSSASKLHVLRFGDAKTIQAWGSGEFPSVAAENFDSAFPIKESEFHDSDTLIEPARASVMKYAEDKGIRQYILIEVTDAQADDKSNIPPEYTALVQRYHSGNRRREQFATYVHSGTGKKMYNGKNYKLNVILTRVALSMDEPPPELSNPRIVPQPALADAEITVSWQQANKAVPEPVLVEVKSDVGAVKWRDHKVLTNTATIPAGTFEPGGYKVEVRLASGKGNTIVQSFTVAATAMCQITSLAVNPPSVAPGNPLVAKWTAAPWNQEVFKAEVVPSAGGAAVWSKGDIPGLELQIPGTLEVGKYRLTVQLANGRSNLSAAPFDVTAVPVPQAEQIVIVNPQTGVPQAAGVIKIAWKLSSGAALQAGKQFKVVISKPETPPVEQNVAAMQTGVSIEEEGEYTVTVSCQGLRAASLTFQVEGEGAGGGLLWGLLGAGALGAGGYWMMRRRSGDSDDSGSVNPSRQPPPVNGFDSLD